MVVAVVVASHIYHDFICFPLLLPLDSPQVPGGPGHAKSIQYDESETNTTGEELHWPTGPAWQGVFQSNLGGPVLGCIRLTWGTSLMPGYHPEFLI